MAPQLLLTQQRREDGVLVLRFRNGPVNALASSLQRAISDAIRHALSDQAIRAIVLIGDPARGYFSAGADVTEFAHISTPAPGHQVLDSDATWFFLNPDPMPKPVVAAVGGVCFGGGCELAIACTARVATDRASFSLPELRLGIIPGLGGTQRLPRLVGFQNGLRMMLYSTVMTATLAHQTGLVDRLVSHSSTEDLIQCAAAYALELAAGRVRKELALTANDKIPSVSECERISREFNKDIWKLSKGGKMPQYSACIAASLYGVRYGGRKGLMEEGRLFFELVTSPTSRALVHAFFAQRGSSKVDLESSPGEDAAGPPPGAVAVIGGGLMGSGIAAACLLAGMRVVIKEINEEAARAATKRVIQNLSKKADLCTKNLRVVTSFEGFDQVDMVIEAALENVKVKQDLFESLASCTSPHCILATNTSTINIDLIAGKVPDAHQAGRIIGVHFFSPAHKMPLLEIIRTTSTSARTIRTTLAFAKKIRKIPVIVGNCAGFAVNRVYFPQSQVATLLVDRLGLHPYQIDDACENFGLPMGPFRLMDMVGLDIGHAVGQVFGMAFPERVYPSNLVQSLLEAGHKGQKTGQGFYRYIEGSRAPIRDSSVLDKFLPPNLQGGQGNTKFLNSDIIEMTLLPCYNEASRIFHEGIVEKTSDIDIATIFGMAFPEYYGGLVYWGDSFCGGPARVCQRLQHFYELSGHHPIFKPSFALTRAAQQSCLLRNLRKPHRDTGGKDDIVVVSALRTAVGRAGRGGFKNTAAEDILAPVLEATLKQTGICPREVDDIVVGTVLGRGDSSVVQLRVANFLVGGLETNPVKTVNRLCSSGLQAIADAANAIAMGNYDIAVAGGMESMSENAFSNNTLKMNPKAKGNVGACNSYLSMGETSENVAAAFNISRLEQDILAVASHSRAGVAMLAGRQRNEIVPVVTKVLVKNKETGEQYEKQVVVNRDEGIRLGVSVQSLGRLKPVFRENGSTTAGNASQVSDGAALVTLMKREEARRRGLRPLGTLRSFAVAGVDPRVMGIGPVYAIPKALQKAGLTVDDMDLIELNEAFGSQATYCIETLRLNRDIVNVNGGAIAIGHPLGMTGARCTVSILHELARRGGRYGLVSMCVGTGMGAAAVYEVNEDSPAPKL